MSNLGLKIALREAGISLRETGVGDRYVLEGMREGGFNLGGEQSGHVIFADHATTGDGVLTGLQIAAQVALTGRPLKELAKVMTKLPQVLINVKGVDRTRVNGDEGGGAAVAAAEADSATPDASCCARRAPSRWSASWWKPATTTPPRTSPSAWPRWSGPNSPWPSSPNSQPSGSVSGSLWPATPGFPTYDRVRRRVGRLRRRVPASWWQRWGKSARTTLPHG